MDKALKQFTSKTLFEASLSLLDTLKFKYRPGSSAAQSFEKLYKEPIKNKALQDAVDHIKVVDGLQQTYLIGIINSDSFLQPGISIELAQELIRVQQDAKYKGMFIFAVEMDDSRDAKGELCYSLTRTACTNLTRGFNHISKEQPVTLLIKQGNKLSIATCERSDYKQAGHVGQKVGKVSVVRDINCDNPHRGHLDILNGLSAKGCSTFDELYRFWFSTFDISTLNNRFYIDLQKWFYWATSEIELPQNIYNNQSDEHFKQNFLVRLLSRTMFCWFLKEHKLIDNRLLSLVDPRNNERYPITHDISEPDFLNSSSYYRGVLQNLFFYGLNSGTKTNKKDFKYTRYLPSDFDYSMFTKVPFLNGSIFRPLDEDFTQDSIEDSVMRIPNSLFYGDDAHAGINQIFNNYKFTIEENTPTDVAVALDPEMLGQVFENLLAEIDPQNDAATAKSIRKATGSFYTPRPVIQSMVDESLMQYLSKHLDGSVEATSILIDLIYGNKLVNDMYNQQVVDALYSIRVLDPACGSGAFPMGILQRIVDLLRIVDPKGEAWLNLMLRPIEDITVRDQFAKQLQGSTSDYTRKLGIIRNCIYAIDIQPIAVQITKLRFFISLLADQKVDKSAENCGILAFPNLETKVVCADSLMSLREDLYIDEIKADLIKARNEYYQPNITVKDREKVADEIADLLDVLFPAFAENLGLNRISNKAVLKRWFLEANINAPFFNMQTFFPEVNQGFDVVIGNPPYGGFKIAEAVRTPLDLGSNDPYGAFISTYLGDGTRPTCLKTGGTLAFIVSDTFMTIGTHLKLRTQMMHNRIHKMIRMSPKTFSATVNTAIIICEKCKAEMGDPAIKGHYCTMADMTNIDIHTDYKHFTEVLEFSMYMDGDECISNEEYAVYRYPQALINNCSNKPFFVASPKLFELMNDVNPVRKAFTQINGNAVQYRVNKINGKEIAVYKLGNISDVKVGLQTGDNPAYLFQNPEARGSYRSINDYEDYILTEDDLNRIHSNSKLRLSIIEKGISVDDSKSDRYFGGRYIARYDKGGESDAEGGWMPNYYVPTDYYIDWSEWAVNRMQTLTIAQRKIDNKENKKVSAKDKTTLSGVYRNSVFYFKKSITYSKTGVYTPTFRIGEGGPFDQKSSFVDIQGLPVEYSICILSSKLMRCLQKSILNHSVDFGKEDMILLPFTLEKIDIIESLAKNIIQKQKRDRFYDYASHEQIEIDRLVCEAYGLNEDDIKEVETWYVRRYPKLAAAQRRNLELANQQEA